MWWQIRMSCGWGVLAGAPGRRMSGLHPRGYKGDQKGRPYVLDFSNHRRVGFGFARAKVGWCVSQ